jgi:hypothetical protein
MKVMTKKATIHIQRVFRGIHDRTAVSELKMTNEKEQERIEIEVASPKMQEKRKIK